MGIMQGNSRKHFLDVAKGLLIILVVMGHSPQIQPFLKNVIYWFHMPAFFMISGYLFSSPFDKGLEFKKWFTNMSKRYFIPYFAYYFLISVFISRSFSVNDFFSFLYGGRMYQGVFWYIPCLFFTIMIFAFINHKFSKVGSVLFLLSLFILGHIESLFYLPNNTSYLSWSIIYKIPLNLDVCFVSLTYFSVGYYLKGNIAKIARSKKMFLLLTILCSSLIVLSFYNLFNFSIDMKLANYKNVLNDMIVPLMFSIWILQISNLISSISFVSKPLGYVGKTTLPIMYLHLPLSGFLQRFEYGHILFVVIGVLIPLCFAYICSKNKILSYLFLGNNQNWDISKILRGKKSSNVFNEQ